MSAYSFRFDPPLPTHEFTNVFREFVCSADPEQNRNFRMVAPHGLREVSKGYAANFTIKGTLFRHIDMWYIRGEAVLAEHEDIIVYGQLHILIGAFREYLDAQGLVYTVGSST